MHFQFSWFIFSSYFPIGRWLSLDSNYASPVHHISMEPTFGTGRHIMLLDQPHTKHNLSTVPISYTKLCRHQNAISSMTTEFLSVISAIDLIVSISSALFCLQVRTRLSSRLPAYDPTTTVSQYPTPFANAIAVVQLYPRAAEPLWPSMS